MHNIHWSYLNYLVLHHGWQWVLAWLRTHPL